VDDLKPSRCAVIVVGRFLAGSPIAGQLAELERRGYPVWHIASEGNADLVRSQAVSAALARGFRETLWVDAAIEFDPNDVVKLRAHQLPLVTGICPRRGGLGLDLELLPSISRLELGIGGGLLEIQYASAGFLHVRHDVYDAQRTQLNLPSCTAGAGPPFVPYFQPMVKQTGVATTYLEADFAFCERARQCGFSIFADTTIRLWRNGDYRFSWEDMAGGPPRSATCELRVAASTAASAEEPATELARREPFRSPELEAFRQAHPWPDQQPSVTARENEGWLFPTTQEMLARFLSNKTQLVIELGSWLGLSTRFLASRAPRATIIAIDHWQGSPEHQQDPQYAGLLSVLFETFLVNCWAQRGRIVPVRAGTIEGMERVARAGLQPDVIYVDADHGYDGVSADLRAIQRLFPSATIVGDDWNWEGVRTAATSFSQSTGRRLESLEAGWCIFAR
jgi:hypothetical protein